MDFNTLKDVKNYSSPHCMTKRLQFQIYCPQEWFCLSKNSPPGSYSDITLIQGSWKLLPLEEF